MREQTKFGHNHQNLGRELPGFGIDSVHNVGLAAYNECNSKGTGNTGEGAGAGYFGPGAGGACSWVVAVNAVVAVDDVAIAAYSPVGQRTAGCAGEGSYRAPAIGSGVKFVHAVVGSVAHTAHPTFAYPHIQLAADVEGTVPPLLCAGKGGHIGPGVGQVVVALEVCHVAAVVPAHSPVAVVGIAQLVEALGTAGNVVDLGPVARSGVVAVEVGVGIGHTVLLQAAAHIAQAIDGKAAGTEANRGTGGQWVDGGPGVGGGVVFVEVFGKGGIAPGSGGGATCTATYIAGIAYYKACRVVSYTTGKIGPACPVAAGYTGGGTHRVAVAACQKDPHPVVARIAQLHIGYGWILGGTIVARGACPDVGGASNIGSSQVHVVASAHRAIVGGGRCRWLGAFGGAQAHPPAAIPEFLAVGGEVIDLQPLGWAGYGISLGGG